MLIIYFACSPREGVNTFPIIRYLSFSSSDIPIFLILYPVIFGPFAPHNLVNGGLECTGISFSVTPYPSTPKVGRLMFMAPYQYPEISDTPFSHLPYFRNIDAIFCFLSHSQLFTLSCQYAL